MNVLAVDGGASSTRALIGTAAGEVLAIGTAGPSNHLHGEAGKKRLRRALGQSIGDARSQLAPCSTEAFASCWLGMTGVREGGRDEAFVISCIQKLVRCQKVAVSGDARIALAGASGNRPGILVYAGTGSISFGLGNRGPAVRSGGWGYLIDDEGGGYQIGRAALKAVFRAIDGRGQATRLQHALFRHFGVEDPRHLIPIIYAEDGLPRPAVSRLARLVAAAARDGDAVARAILEDAAHVLAQLAVNTARLLPDPPSPLVIYYAGGVFQAGPALVRPFEEDVLQHLPGARVAAPIFPPIIGSYLLALELLGIETTAGITAKIRETLAALPEEARV